MACNYRHATRASRHSASTSASHGCHIPVTMPAHFKEKNAFYDEFGTRKKERTKQRPKTKANKVATRFTCYLYRLMPRLLRLLLCLTVLHNLSFPLRIRLIHVPSRPVYCPAFVRVFAAAFISVIQTWSKTEHIRYTWFSSGPQTISQLMYINKQPCTNISPSVSSSVGWI
jgi:hypothetical protein